MLLNNEFVVDAPAQTAWTFLTDLERVAVCLPGASLDGREDEAYVGRVKVKVGPISANFQGTARFIERDDAAHAATIVAVGKDQKGQATANATIRARLEQEGPSRTRVLVDTELEISGRMAQFGRGAIADVSARLMNQFADNLSARITTAPATNTEVGTGPDIPVAAVPTAPAGVANGPAGGTGLDVVSLIGPVLLKRLGPVLLGAVLGATGGWLLRGRRVNRRDQSYGWEQQ
jgi:carbon monoxide dehydrogenase subunit G